MKNQWFLILLSFLIFSEVVPAQNANATQNEPSKPQTKSRFYFGLHSETFKLTEGNLWGWIVDDSPSQDWLMVDLDLAATERARGFHFGLEYSYPNHFVWNADLAFSFNSEGRMFGGNLGFGYELKKQKFQVIPMLKLGMGNGNFKLGDIQNEDLFIQINDTQFYGDEVEARLKDLYAYVAPEINFSYALNEKIDIRLTAGYKLANNRKPIIEFNGITDVEESDYEKDTRDLNHSKNQLSLEGVPLNENSKLAKFQGAYFKVSIVKNLSRK